MPLFVPILRVLMLFLNVYDSYKTLKHPPVSSRHEGRPSIRALTQRKRDMKGCLAVWIVWCAITLYERFVESIISLFIPFYDEFKSLALLFLIVTRAKGAEPIYLHLIRPIIKPYTTTLDGILDLTLLLGDFILALSTYPIRLLIQFWQKRFGRHYEPLETETDSQSEISQDTTPSEFAAPSEAGSEVILSGNGIRGDAPSTPQPSRRSTVDRAREAPNRRPSAETTRSRTAAPGRASSRPVPVPVPVTRPTAPARQSSRNLAQSKTTKDSVASRSGTLGANGKEASSPHQIWYPPASAYVDEPERIDGLPPTSDTPLTSTIPSDDHDADSRDYPAFPSAYPLTPPPASTLTLNPDPSALPSLSQTLRQDFPLSLQLQREPMNPSSVNGSSDQTTPGVPVFSPFSPSTDSAALTEEGGGALDTDDEYDDEDSFNTTLRTPLPPFGNLRSQLRPSLITAVPSASSSVPSRASGLTSLDNGSLRTSNSSGSAGSAVTTSPVISRKHTFTRASRSTITPADDDSLGEEEEDNPASGVDGVTLPSDMSDTMEEELSSIASSTQDGEFEQQIQPEEKRRKATRTPSPRRPRTRPKETNGGAPTTRHAKTNSTHGTGPKPSDRALAAAKRSSARLRATASDPPAPKLGSRTTSQSTTDSAGSDGRRNKPAAARR